MKPTLLSLALLLSACAPRPGDPLTVTAAATTRCGDRGAVVHGVDVSSYEGGNIDWSSARAAGYDFGVVKTTEGLTYTDATFAANWAHMKSAGVVRGAYHFLHENDSGAAQADRMLDLIDANGGLDPGDLPPTIDLEVTDGQSTSTILGVVQDFVAEVEARAHRTPILYTYLSFWQDTLGNPSPPALPLWIAVYNGQSCPQLPDSFSRWALWQYTDSAQVPGVGKSDGDLFNGSLDDLRAFAGGGLIIDNGDHAFSSAGSWRHSTSVAGYVGADYLVTPAQSAAWGAWGVYGHAGLHELFARYTPFANRSSRALYRVRTAPNAPPVEVRIDQRSGGRVSLGTFTLSDSASVSVDASDGDGYTVADAVEIIAR